jgi:superfamily I DNA/RNA helicase
LKNRVALRCGEVLSSRFDSYTFHAFAKRLIDKFRIALVGPNALDPDYTIGDERVHRRQIKFDDMIPLALEIIDTCPAAARSVRASYSDVFLDEFQDCTDVQYRLIKELFRGTAIRLTSVGDTKQKIMGFAGALEGIFQTFAADFNAVPLNLYRNFRSKPRLLRLQNQIIARMDPDSVMADELVAGEEGELRVMPFENADDEAVALAEMIEEWIREEEIPPWEIAILLSRQIKEYAVGLMRELSVRGIPFRNEHDVQEDLSNPVIEVFIDYLRILSGTGCPESYLRIKRLVEFDEQSEWAGKQGANRWDKFFRSERKTFAELGQVDESETWKFLKRLVSHLGRPRFDELCSHSGYTLRESAKRAKPIIRAALATGAPLHEALGSLAQSESVKLLTVHKSKGLEFHSVIFMGIERETFWGNPANERCNYFVGISRAKRRLVLTTADYRPRPEHFGGMWRETRHPHEEFLGYSEGI